MGVSNEEHIEKLRHYFEWWVEYLGLNSWRIALVYSKRNKISDKFQYITAEAFVSWEYLRAKIKCYMPSIKRIDSDKELESVVVHELMHVHLKELDDAPKADRTAHGERVATQLANAFIWVRNQAYEEGFKAGKKSKEAK